MRNRIIFILGVLGVLAFMVFMTASMKKYMNRPLEKSWTKINKIVKQNRKDGDSLAFYPPWLAGYARDHNRFSGMSGVKDEDIVGKGPKDFSRIWIISCFGSFNDGKMNELYANLINQNIDGVSILLYKLKGADISFRLSEKLADVKVFHKKGKMLTELALQDGSYSLSGKERVQKTWSEFRKLPKQGVLTPVRRGASLKFDLGQLPAGHAVLCGGVTDGGLFSLDFHPVQAVVKIGNKKAGSFSFHGKSGWWCHSVKRPNSDGQVQITLNSDARSKKRAFMFDFFVM